MSQTKKFSIPLAIEGTESQLVEIFSDLTKLGYVASGMLSERFYPPGGWHLITNAYTQNGILDYFKTYQSGRTVVQVSDRSLVLALAAMTDNKEFYPGEYVVVTNNGTSYTTHRDFSYRNSYNELAPEKEILRVVENIDYTNHPALHLQTIKGDKNYLVGITGLRKATKEEIITGFTIADAFANEEYKPLVLVNLDFLHYLHSKVEKTLKLDIEEEFPEIFPRPTFRVGDRINMDVPGGIRHLMITGIALGSTISIVDLFTGEQKMGALADVEDINKITEEELLQAGGPFGLTRENYTIVDCGIPLPTCSELPGSRC